ncbi:MAG TPA: hypothetical protein VFE85_01645 [Woeseiaceae bacterium]|nr:hypothetical protein [Woeseiaceae bacterium]
MYIDFKLAGALACALAVLLPVEGVLADEPQDDTGGERCISLQRIDRTEVLDDQSILFYMRGGEIYRNILRHRCPGLRDNRPFMYSATASQLCDLDQLTVLYDHGIGFTPGISCGLGRFHPVSEQDVEALKEPPPGPQAKPVPSAEPEEIEPPDEQ